nr:phage tail protein [uncultured Celeribacter sp.]
MKRLILSTTALIALGASPAEAGAVAAAVSWVGGVIASGGVAGALMQMAIGVGANLLASAFGQKSRAAQVSVQLNVQFGDAQPLGFLVGESATAGAKKYVGSWGKNTRFVTEVYEVSALPQGLNGVWVDDEQGDFVAGVTGYVPEGRSPGSVSRVDESGAVPEGALVVGSPLGNKADDGNRIWIKWVDGTQTAADPFLLWAFGDDDAYPWTHDHIGIGKSYAIVTNRYDSDTLTSLPGFLFEPAPLPLYDPRLDDTVGGVGPHRWGDAATYAPTTNAAVIAYNIARGIYYGDEWVFGGRNLDAWRLPLAEWVAAMNSCDAPVDLAGGGAEPAYRAGAVIKADMTGADALEEIGRASNMRFAEVGGMIKPMVDVPAAAVLAITDEDILITEGQSYRPFLSVGETFNSISAVYPEREEKWASKDAPEYIDSEALADDGDRYLPTSVSYGAAPYSRQVQRLQRAQMRDYRRMRQHQFYLPPDAYALEPLVDMVSWTSARNGYEGKLFLVTSVTKQPGLNVLVTMREVEPGDYDWSSTFERDVTVIAPLPTEYAPQTVTNFSAVGVVIEDADGNSRRSAIQVSCDTEDVGVTDIWIQARHATTGVVAFDGTLPFNDAGVWYIHSVIGGQSYEVRAELLSVLTPLSEWSDWVSVVPPAVGVGVEDLAEEITGAIIAASDAASQAQSNADAALEAVGDYASSWVLSVTEGASSAEITGVAMQDGSTSFSAITISADVIQFEGEWSNFFSDVFIDGGLVVDGTITAAKMNVSELSALSATIGILRTATSGARQEIHSDKIMIYDENNVVRVRLGNLST